MLSFCNQYPQPVWVVIGWYDPGCADGGDWSKAGWWYMNQGDCVNVLDVDLDELNRYYVFYAEADDGAFWAGPYGTTVPWEAFDMCWPTATSDARFLGLRLIDVGGNDDYTVNLVP
jgi:uncharacterized membrane protein